MEELTTYRVTLTIRSNSNPKWIEDAIIDSMEECETLTIDEIVELTSDTPSDVTE